MQESYVQFTIICQVCAAKLDVAPIAICTTCGWFNIPYSSVPSQGIVDKLTDFTKSVEKNYALFRQEEVSMHADAVKIKETLRLQQDRLRDLKAELAPLLNKQQILVDTLAQSNNTAELEAELSKLYEKRDTLEIKAATKKVTTSKTPEIALKCTYEKNDNTVKVLVQKLKMPTTVELLIGVAFSNKKIVDLEDVQMVVPVEGNNMHKLTLEGQAITLNLVYYLKTNFDYSKTIHLSLRTQNNFALV